MTFDKWTLLKVFEVCFTIACLICKRVTDDEASRLFLYLQKLSREWSLLNNVTWDRIGAAVADTTYGGYTVITAALLIGRIAGELPTPRRVIEIVLLGIGTLLFVVLGSLEFAALDSVPPDLVDNAAVLGSLSLITAASFLLDLGGPRSKKVVAEPKNQRKRSPEIANDRPDANSIEAAVVAVERKELETLDEHSRKVKSPKDQNGGGPKAGNQNGFKTSPSQQGYKKMKERESGRRFDVYGKDGGQPEEAERHSPVWSQIRKGQYGKYDIVVPSYLYTKGETPSVHQDSQPSSPGDPGYVQYTAKRWGEPSQRTPRHSPTQV